MSVYCSLWFCHLHYNVQAKCCYGVHISSCDVKPFCELLIGSQDLNDEFSKLSAHEARQRLVVLLHHMDTNSDLLISQQEISDWVLNSFRYVCTC